jgi:GH18 family chitinase
MATDAWIARSKLGIGMPFYARIRKGCRAGYLAATTCTQGVNAPSQRYASGDALTNPRNAINYNDLVNSVYWTNGTRVWDAIHGAQYIQYTNSANSAFVSYTGVEQIQESVSYVKKANLGGIMTYELTNEYIASQSGDRRYPLSTAMYNAMTGGATPR